jgi:hypothetical protein
VCAPPFRHQPLIALCVFVTRKSRRALPLQIVTEHVPGSHRLAF